MLPDSSNEDNGVSKEEQSDSLPSSPVLPEVPQLARLEKRATHVSPLPKAPQFDRAVHKRRDTPTEQSRQTATSVLVLSTATTVFLPIIVFPLVGYWLDQRYHHTFAYLALIGLALGVASSVSGISGLLKRLK